MELKKYDLIGEPIGVGSYGRVFKGKVKETGEHIAVKLIDKKNYERKERKSFHKECRIHAELRHPNIIKMLNSFETPDYIVVVTELAEIDLHKFMGREKLSPNHVQKLTWNLLSALYYLHSKRILHRDLKPQNILLSGDINQMNAKLCDFGLARNMTREDFLLTSIKGTPLYMAPEVMIDAVYDETADLWSVACVLYETLFDKPPIKTHSLSQLLQWWRNPEILWPKLIDEDCKSLLQGLLKKDPKSRMKWSQILAHPFVKDNLLILENNETEQPLTQTLTTSQLIRKQKQRDEIVFHRGKRIIAEAMSKCQLLNPQNQQGPSDAKAGKIKKKKNVISDNESISSSDSINAIIQTDLETDVEGPMIKKPITVHQINPITAPPDNQNFVIQRYADNFAVTDDKVTVQQDNKDEENTNLKIGNMLDNFQDMQLADEAQWNAMKNKQQTASTSPCEEKQNAQSDAAQSGQSSNKSGNIDLMQRKLNQNLENFSIRLGNTSANIEKSGEEFDKDDTNEKTENNQNLNSKQFSETNVTEHSDSKMDTYDDQCSPIENEEWLAFIHMSMQEVLNNEMDTLKHHNLVGMIVAILRNLNANNKVIESVVQLLSIPFVLPISRDDIAEIQTVYLQAKLVPNLVFASKIICTAREGNPSFSSTMSSSNFVASNNHQEGVIFKKMSDLSTDQLKTLINVFELVCHLIHLSEHFLAQFCDSVYIIASDLLRHLLTDVVYDVQSMRLLCVIVSILCFVLRETPENGEIVEGILFSSNVSLIEMLKNGNPVLKSRLCMLLRIIGRFSCHSLQNAWTLEFKQTLEDLMDEQNETVKSAAKYAIEELKHFSFYNTQ